MIFKELLGLFEDVEDIHLAVKELCDGTLALEMVGSPTYPLVARGPSTLRLSRRGWSIAGGRLGG